MFRPMFVPPREHPLVIQLCNAFLPALSSALGNIRDVNIADSDFEHLQALSGSRAILTPNHPTGMDPLVMVWVSRRLGQPFNYLAAREVMDGFRGWLMSRMGAYSVIRGVPDRESLRTTRRLLGELNRKVVIFPEGEIYEHNDKLLAFQSGVAQIGFWTLDDLEKSRANPSLPILPVAVKYRLCDSPRLAIEHSLQDLERALALSDAPGLTAYQRLRRVGDRLLASLERDEGLTPQEGGDLNDRIKAVRQAVLARVAHAIRTEIDTRQPPADQLHELFNELKSWVGLLPEEGSDYDERLYRRRMEIAAPLFNDLHRLQNFIAVTGDYVAAEATAERFMEVLGRIEKEVLGEIRHHVPREALVRIAAPIRLEERYAEYRKNKRETVAAVTLEMETTIREMLRELSAQSTPIAIDA